MRSSERFEVDRAWGEWAAQYISTFFNDIAKNHIYLQGGTKVVDVCQKGAKVDVVLERKDGKTEFAEVKSFRFQKKRLIEFFVEIFSCTNPCYVTPGWFYTCDAAALIIFAIQQKKNKEFDVWGVEWDKLRSYVNQNTYLPKQDAMPSIFNTDDWPLTKKSWQWWVVTSQGNTNHTASIRIPIRNVIADVGIRYSGRVFEGPFFLKEDPVTLLRRGSLMQAIPFLPGFEP